MWMYRLETCLAYGRGIPESAQIIIQIEECRSLQTVVNSIWLQTGYKTNCWDVFTYMFRLRYERLRHHEQRTFDLQSLDPEFFFFINVLDDIGKPDMLKNIPENAIIEVHSMWDRGVSDPVVMRNVVQAKLNVRLEAWDVYKILYFKHWLDEPVDYLPYVIE